MSCCMPTCIVRVSYPHPPPLPIRLICRVYHGDRISSLFSGDERPLFFYYAIYEIMDGILPAAALADLRVNLFLNAVWVFTLPRFSDYDLNRLFYAEGCRHLSLFSV